MIRRSTALALALSSILLAACQTESPRMARYIGTPARAPASSPMDGQWASADGIFVASFRGGRFTSVDARTQAVLAEGSYFTTGNGIEMQWLSAATQQQRQATCSFVGPRSVNCTQTGATPFQLNRQA
jgi:hypothetical protein